MADQPTGTPLAFAIWNGSQQDRDGRKTFPSGTPWSELMNPTLEPQPTHEVFAWDQTDLYRFFAFAFGPPTEERHCWFAQGGVTAALAGLWHKISPQNKFPGFEWFRDCASYETAYIAIIDVGVPEPPVPLFESAHEKSRPAQELVLENTYFYDVFGLRGDPALAVPDPLVT